ncbi:hypothetical protein FJ656_02010 [Schumannella luteola]|uniref:Uncharacterized protein n=1 Tax=Schumannella luteola TaxID=472059 RepID=A0A852YMW5_9MICO|nr:hypothetical protein [Schumannella luteola]NYG99079.1 hypothetical protein [Schumannella luteola]TPX06428.1 hypothetical protein FJ656_02010 [Schumannella luteola]
MVVIRPVDYEFPSTVDHDDLNWLIIEGHVRAGDEEWGFRDPALQVDDARALGTWLAEVLRDEVETTVDGLFDGEPQFSALEPNIGFGFIARTTTSVTLRVFLRAESAPPSRRSDSAGRQAEFFVDLSLDADDLRLAISIWREECALFPDRFPQ